MTAIYIFDRNNPVSNISAYCEDYHYLIWTRRYSSLGDFELKVEDNSTNRSKFQKDRVLSINPSEEYRLVESLTRNQGILNVSGRTSTSFLERRTIINNVQEWALFNHTLYELVRRNGGVEKTTGARRIPYLRCSFGHPPNFEQPDDFERPTVGSNLLRTVEDLTSTHDLGLKMTVEPDKNGTFNYVFYIYNGIDRSTNEKAGDITLTKETGGLMNINRVNSDKGSVNTVYVDFPKRDDVEVDIRRIVYRGGREISGFDRREEFTDASSIRDIPGYVPDMREGMLQVRGRKVLFDNQPISAFSFEQAQNPSFLLGRDYNLGDILLYQDEDGSESRFRVAEEIFASNGEKVIRYPTLSELP